MRAVEISKPGGPDVLRLADAAKPAPKANEILVKVAAAGVNRPDILQRMGNYPVPPGASPLPGHIMPRTASQMKEAFVMNVAERNSAMSHDRLPQTWTPVCTLDDIVPNTGVCALVNGGGYAEYCTVPESQALPVPKDLSMVEAASLPETCFTVWGNVYDRGRLARGESLLVQGGTSGIGVTAIQMAAATGNRVFATAGSAEKVAACVKLGAEKAFNYKTQDWVAEARAATGGKGVNVILDMVGGDYVPRELKCLAEDGRLVFIAFLRDGASALPEPGCVPATT